MVRRRQEQLVVTSSNDNVHASRTLASGGMLVLLAAVGFSAKAVLVKLAYASSPHLDAITLMGLRMLLSLPFFLAVALWSHRGGERSRLSRRELATAAGLGVLGFYVAGLLDFEGLSYIPAGLERLILFLYPTLVVIFSAVIAGRPMHTRERIALLLSYLGIVLMAGGDTAVFSKRLVLGASLVFGAALSFALYILISGRFIPRIGSTRFTAYVMSSACIATILHYIVSHHDSAVLALPLRVYGLAVLMALFSTVVPAFLLNAGMQRIGASSTSIISSIGPVMTLFFAYGLLDETLTPTQIAGTVLVIAGVVIITHRDAQTKNGQ